MLQALTLLAWEEDIPELFLVILDGTAAIRIYWSDRSVEGRRGINLERRASGKKEDKWRRKISIALLEKSRGTSTAFYLISQKMVSERGIIL